MKRGPSVILALLAIFGALAVLDWLTGANILPELLNAVERLIRGICDFFGGVLGI